MEKRKKKYLFCQNLSKNITQKLLGFLLYFAILRTIFIRQQSPFTTASESQNPPPPHLPHLLTYPKRTALSILHRFRIPGDKQKNGRKSPVYYKIYYFHSWILLPSAENLHSIKTFPNIRNYKTCNPVGKIFRIICFIIF